MGYTVLVALLAFCTVASAVDSEGTNFVFAFVRNSNSDITNQVLTATVLNRNDQDCKFTLTYRPDYHKSTPPENITQTVPTLSAINVAIPSWYGWNYAGENVQDDVYLTLTGFSTCPVTVLANNYDNVTKQGDTYMVLPTTWSSQSFTFSLPPAVISSTVQHYEQVFVLPTTEGNTQVTFVEIGNAQSVFYINATYGNSPAVYVGARTPDSRPRTYHVVSDKPVLIVAGVTCAGIDANSCDHVAYMPHPPAASDCYTWDYYDDDHISYLPTTTQFFTDIPGSCLVAQNITSTLNDGVSRTMRIKPQMESPLWTITTTNANQLGVAFHNGGSNIHIARYYDGTKFGLRGAFIATSPSITQFHNDYSSFYTQNVNDTLEIYCTILSCASLTLDGTSVVGSAQQRVTQSVDGVSYYIFTVPVAQPGFHRLDLDPTKNGNYGFFVSGKNGQYSYGYEGGANKPTFVLAPPTTQGPTTTNTAPTATTSGATVPTVTVPVVTTQTTAPVTSATTPAASPTTAPTTITPGTSKQTSTVATQSTATTTVPVATPSPSTQTSVTTPSPTSQTTPSTVVTTPSVAPITSTSTAAPVTSAQTSTTTQIPVVTSTPSVATVGTSPTTAPTSPPQTTTATQTPPIVTTATTQTLPVITTATTQGSIITTATTQAPVVTTATTQGPVVTSQTTQTPVVTNPTTPTTAKPTPPQTSVPTTATPVVTPVVITTPAPSTAGPTTPQQQPGTSPTTQAPVTGVVGTTPTTPAPPTTTTTRVVTQAPTTTTTQNIPTTTPVVTTPSTAAPTTRPTTAAATTRPATQPATSATTPAPSTTTQSSSIISLAIPTVLTILYALF